MANMLSGKLPCISPDCGSSDARRLYDDGTSFCFSCETFFPKTDESPEQPPQQKESFYSRETPEIISKYPCRGFKERGITKEVCEFFGVKVSYGTDGKIDNHFYPYRNGEAYKRRRVADKDFSWTGKSGGLFGLERFQAGGKRLVITEGEIDALSVAQANMDRYKKMYPVVGVPSSTMTKYLLENRDWIRSFKEVVVMFDEDDAGRKAQKEAIKIIGLDKAKITKLPLNDANEVLLKNGAQALLMCIFDAAPYIPAGIATKDVIWAALEEYNTRASTPYPPCIDGLNEKLKGIRDNEITLLISGTGAGKSTLIREIVLHILDTTDAKVGMVSLEESPAETARKLSGMALLKNPAKDEIPLEELKVGFDRVFGDDRVLLLDHQGSLSDGSIMEQIEYMALAGCTRIFVDHITILVSEGVGDLYGNEAHDKVMNDLARLVNRYPLWIGLVSHLRKAPSGGKSFEEGRMPSIDDIRGSGSIKQISHDVVAFARDMTHKDEKVRNHIMMSVLKCRYTGLTGPINGAYYDYDTGRLKAALSVVDLEDFTTI